MANIFQEKLNMTLSATEADEDDDIDQEKVERLLEEEYNDDNAEQEKVDSSHEKEDKVDDEKIDRCN